MLKSHPHHLSRLAMLILSTVLVGGCPDMSDQPKVKTLRPSAVFRNGQAARPLVDGTVPRNGPDAGKQVVSEYAPRVLAVHPATRIPFPITREDLERGREQFTIFCTPCHGRTGEGNGMIGERGFTKPPSYHIDRLRTVPIGHFYDVITNGYGAMYSYNDRIAPADRWRIAAWIRVLQLSQHAPLDQLPAADRRQLERP